MSQLRDNIASFMYGNAWTDQHVARWGLAEQLAIAHDFQDLIAPDWDSDEALPTTEEIHAHVLSIILEARANMRAAD